MTRGSVKRLGFLVGLVVLFFGAILLIDPMSVEGRNCGSALMRKPVKDGRYAASCDSKLDRRRIPGIVLSVVGAGMVLGIGPRCMLEPD